MRHISADFFRSSNVKNNSSVCVFKHSSFVLFVSILLFYLFLCILDSACRYICDRLPAIDLSQIKQKNELALFSTSRNHNLNSSISSHCGLNVLLYCTFLSCKFSLLLLYKKLSLILFL